jgi:chaperonin GroEL (HSP60 family)
VDSRGGRRTWPDLASRYTSRDISIHSNSDRGVCNDGVTIAKEVDLKDPAENLGAQMIREAAERTGDAVGDGASTSTVIAHAILSEGVRNVAAGASAVDLKRGLDRGLKAAVEALRGVSRPVSSRREKEHVATVSAHNNPEIGKLVADAIEKIGPDGVVTVEEAKTSDTALEIVYSGNRLRPSLWPPLKIQRSNVRSSSLHLWKDRFPSSAEAHPGR